MPEGKPVEKRFILPKQEFAKERLRAIKEAVEAVQKGRAEVLSLCLFGTMISGKARPDSDIDGYLFIDSELLSKKLGVDEGEILYKEGPKKAFLLTPLARLREDKLRRLIEEKAHLQAEQLFDVRAMPVSKYTIDSEIQNGTTGNLAIMFHLDIGGGIRKYRDYLLKKLKEMGNEGEQIWSAMIRDIEKWELGRRPGAKVDYPRTLDRALAIYGMREQ